MSEAGENHNGRDGESANDDWQTPQWLYDQLNAEFNFDFDPCPHKATFDGLDCEWGMRNFVNPPYNRVDKPKWIQKSYEWYTKGRTVVMLIPAATGTIQHHEIIIPNAEIRFLKGRVSFKGFNNKGEWSEKNKGKHDSMIVVFNPFMRNYK